MAADAEGNEIGAVGVPITGFAAVQLSGGPTYVSSSAGAASTLTLPTGYQKVGLFKVDGGPQESIDSGDAIEFFQQGYKLAGDSTITVQINLAEMNTLVRTLIHGVAPNGDGMVTVKSGVPDSTFPLFTAVKFKNGSSERKNGLARISAVEADQATRGEVNGRAVTFEWVYDDTVGGFYREWVVPASVSSSAKTVWTVEITGSPTGGSFTLLVNGMATAPIAYNATASQVAAALNALSGVTGLSGITVTGTTTFTVTFPSSAVLTATHALTGGTTPGVTVS